MDKRFDTMEKRVNDRFDRIESKLDATFDQVSALTESVTVLQSDMAEAKRDIRAIQEVVMQHDEEIITLKRVRWQIAMRDMEGALKILLKFVENA